jgi:hypothetical protein
MSDNQLLDAVKKGDVVTAHSCLLYGGYDANQLDRVCFNLVYLLYRTSGAHCISLAMITDYPLYNYYSMT